MISIKDSWRTVMDAIMDGWELLLIVSRTVGGCYHVWMGAVLDSSCRIVLESQFNMCPGHSPSRQ